MAETDEPGTDEMRLWSEVEEDLVDLARSVFAGMFTDEAPKRSDAPSPGGPRMTHIHAPDTLVDEAAVVVLEPLDRHPWLREHGWIADRPSVGPRPVFGFRVVAFSTVRHGRGHRGPYRRRVWFLKDTDRATYGDHDWPIEAVDPASIAPREASRPMGLPRWRLTTEPF